MFQKGGTKDTVMTEEQFLELLHFKKIMPDLISESAAKQAFFNTSTFIHGSTFLFLPWGLFSATSTLLYGNEASSC
jgi:hypothetical protein